MVMALGTLSTTDCVSRLKHREYNPMKTSLYATIWAECHCRIINAVQLDKSELAIDEKRGGSLVA